MKINAETTTKKLNTLLKKQEKNNKYEKKN